MEFIKNNKYYSVKKHSFSGFKIWNKFYGVDYDYPEEQLFEVDDRTEKVPGKIISHRKSEDDSLELLMKWKYLSYDESTWVKFEYYKNLLIVTEYLNKNIIWFKTVQNK